MYVLNDGEKNIKSIAIILYLRDAETYILDFLIPYLSMLEKRYQIDFYYYIFENDSIDQTVALLTDFMKTRSGKFNTKTLQLNCEKSGITKTRIERITTIRNMLLDEVREELAKHDWCLFIDDDIYPEEDILSLIMSKKPRLDKIAMITCNTLELLKNDGTLNVPEDIPYCTENHYYDTFAFVNIDNCSMYPCCCHNTCTRKECIEKRKNIETLFSKTNKLPLDIRAGWGGLVLIHGFVFKYPEVKWKTFSLNNNSICEHIYLCDMIKAFTGERIVLYPDIICYWIK